MGSAYCAHQFRIITSAGALAEMDVRVHAPDRDEAWRRVMQMHPHAVEVKAHARLRREKSHKSESLIANFTN